MSTAKHTPWPWNVEAAQRGFIVTALNGQYDIAVVRNIGVQDNKANAQLIAAAPELLEALKELSAEEWRDDNDPILDRARSKARAAIAKAEGA